MNDADVNGLFEKLGLTEYEAKTLSTLLKLKEADAPAISRMAQVPKTRVYDVLDRLVSKKLVIEINGRPKSYRGVDTETAVELLLELKRSELKELESKTKRLREAISGWGTAAEDEGEKVMKVKDKNDFIKILSQEIDKAKKEIVALTKLDQEYDLLKESIKTASKNNVAVKIVSHLPHEAHKELGEAGVLLKNFKHGMNAFIIDGKKVILSLTDLEKEKPEYHFTIWPNNPPMALALNGYFEDCWKKGK
jgi:sugar-specific transcriptional regulator TrmB